MDLTAYLRAAAGGVPILFLVYGMVQLLKKLTRADGSPLLSGNALLLASLAWGTALGLGYFLAVSPPWASWAYWFGAAAYGLGLGFLASLFFDSLKQLAEAAVTKMLEQALRKIAEGSIDNPTSALLEQAMLAAARRAVAQRPPPAG